MVRNTPPTVTTVRVATARDARQTAGEWYAEQGAGYWPKEDVMDAFEATLGRVGRARLACCDQHLLVILDDATSGDKPEAAGR